MSLQDQTGKKVPAVSFKVRENNGWVTKTTDDYFKGKNIVLFALPGAFTPTCSSTHLPRYNELYDSFKKAGVDDVVCLSVNDTFVMNSWQENQKASKIKMIPDGNGEFSEKLGFLVDKSDIGFGKRTWRYSMHVVDGEIKKMFIEKEVDGDPFDTSNAETMLNHLNQEVPPSVALYTRKGCPFCAEAKELLKSKDMTFEEHTLGEDYTVKTLVAISGKTSVPQAYINGKHIGGCDDLKKHLA